MRWSEIFSESASEGSPADLLTNDFYEQMEQSGLDAYVEVSLTETNDNTVDLLSILARTKEQGNGSKVLELLTTLADKYGVTLTLSPASDADDLERLVDWYERYGFEGSYNRMRRRPN